VRPAVPNRLTSPSPRSVATPALLLSLEARSPIVVLNSDVPAAVSSSVRLGGDVAAVMIGVDPHKGSHTAFARRSEKRLGQVREHVSIRQVDGLLEWARS
jgi:hypothetical protein